MKEDKCKGCGRPIVWARNTQTGKTVPIDLRVVVYVVLERDDGSIDCVRYEDEHGCSVGVNHFQTCSQANRFSKGGKKPHAAADPTP